MSPPVVRVGRWLPAVLVAGGALVACGSGGSDAGHSADPTVTTAAAASTTSGPVATSVEETGLPDGYVVRATDAPDREEVLRRLEDVVAEVGEHRAGVFDGGDAFVVRVVAPTDADADAVARVQAGTEIPLRVVEVTRSESWLNGAMGRLVADLAEPGVSAGADLVRLKLQVLLGPEASGLVRDDAFAARVDELVDGYLAEGRAAGAVADEVTAADAVEIVTGSFSTS